VPRTSASRQMIAGFIDDNWILFIKQQMPPDCTVSEHTIQLILAHNMRLRISIPDYDFRITNLDSVNLCTSKEHFHTDFIFPHFHTDFLIGT
jgi:hypothetical protein